MGSWSVYCSISQIAITAGDDCVLLPIWKAKYQNYHYFTWYPATLPIFGEYDDYGGIENIIKDENTALIEEHFGMTIEEFCRLFTDGIIGRGGEEKDELQAIRDKSPNFKEMENWSFMWIKREVYNYLSTFTVQPGHLSFGKPFLLKLLGFELQDTKIEGRWNQHWTKGDVSLYGDGEWIQTKPGKDYSQSIFNFRNNKKDPYDIAHYIDMNEYLWLKDKDTHQLYEYMDTSEKRKHLASVLTGEHFNADYSFLKMDPYDEPEESFKKWVEHGFADPNDEKAKANLIALFQSQIDERSSLRFKYLKNIDIYAKLLSDLMSIAGAFHVMSKTFEPYILYLTPQCGEHRIHQKILEKFALINKAHYQKQEEFWGSDEKSEDL